MSRLKSFFEQCLRVWYLLKKPTKDELITIAKVSAIGISLVGLIGFLISIIMNFFKF